MFTDKYGRVQIGTVAQVEPGPNNRAFVWVLRDDHVGHNLNPYFPVVKCALKHVPPPEHYTQKVDGFDWKAHKGFF